MRDIIDLIEQGIKIEDEFIETYMEVLQDSSFSQYFDKNEAKAKILVKKLLKESSQHKASLEDLIIQLT